MKDSVGLFLDILVIVLLAVNGVSVYLGGEQRWPLVFLFIVTITSRIRIMILEDRAGLRG